jgi:predicted Zn-dependent peptidase
VTEHPAPGVARTVLPGGLRVVTEHVAGARSASVGLWVDVGSRDEPGFDPASRGAAHFLEHLLFKGTRRRSARQIAEEIDAVGGDLNAFTTKEHTCFYAHVLDSDMPLAVDVVCDVVLDGVMAADDVALERDVVLSEIAGRDDDPEDLLADDFDDLLLGDHPLGGPVVGSEESVAEMSRDVLARFHAAHYVPSRSVLAVAGNVTHAAVLDAVTAGFGGRLTAGTGSWTRPGAAVRPPARAGRLAVREDDTEQAHLMLGVPSVRRGDPRWEAELVLSTVLGGGTSSRLFQEVRERRGLAYSVYSATTGYSDLGVLSVYVGCAPERLGTAAGVLRTELADLARNGITDAELARARGQLRGEYVLGLEDTSSRMSWLGRRELDGRDSSLDLADSLARIDAVTRDDVAELAADLFSTPVTAAVVGPYADADDLPGELREVAG